jgi:23S rRNA A2030 N6-methylase RlmJ
MDRILTIELTDEEYDGLEKELGDKTRKTVLNISQWKNRLPVL